MHVVCGERDNYNLPSIRGGMNRVYGDCKKVAYSNTEEEYVGNCDTFKGKYGNVEDGEIVHYLEDTWLVHQENAIIIERNWTADGSRYQQPPLVTQFVNQRIEEAFQTLNEAIDSNGYDPESTRRIRLNIATLI